MNKRRYVALLRGINISGKNKIAMSELKANFQRLGYTEVVTYLNSGNVAFTCEQKEEAILVNAIEAMIAERFGLQIPVYVISQEELEDVLNHVPNWWGSEDKEIYDNLIFLFPPLSYEEFCVEVGSSRKEYEKVYPYKNIIFWSFSRKNYQKTNWWSKTANCDIKDRITIRTANTVKKIVEM